MQNFYKHQYRFNATHSMSGKKENEHQHTFTVCVYVSRQRQDETILFYDFDEIAKNYFKGFEQVYLNECEQFKDVIPNIENMGDIFFDELEEKLDAIGVRLHQLDIYENFLCVYQVSNRIHLAAPHENDIKAMIEEKQ